MMKLEAKHLCWVFDAAGEHYAKEVDRLENEITRHRLFLHEPIVTSRLSKDKTRVERIEEAQVFLEQFRTIVLFCKEMRNRAADKSAQEFAAAFKEYLGKK